MRLCRAPALPPAAVDVVLAVAGGFALAGREVALVGAEGGDDAETCGPAPVLVDVPVPTDEMAAAIVLAPRGLAALARRVP